MKKIMGRMRPLTFRVFVASFHFCKKREKLLKTQGLKQTRHGVGGRRTALVLGLGLYTPPSSRFTYLLRERRYDDRPGFW